MSEIKLLDCTLRDGGYINDWKFGFHTTRDIISKLIDSGVDYVEVGFLRDCEYDREAVLFNSCKDIMPLLPPKHKRGNTQFSAMALHNKYDISKLEDCGENTVDIIRVTFHDYDIDEGLAYIRKVKEKGYKVFCNPINIMGYSDTMVLDLLNKVNEIQPYGFSIVDTFGSMMKSDLRRLYSMIEHNLDKNIVLGLHLHENLGLAYSLAQEFLDMKSPERQCVIDGSMLGMGRVPGNLCIELIMDYMNRERGASYDVDPVLDGIDDHIAELKKIEAWGYNTAYALSAKYNLHRNYAEYLVNKGRLRAKQINRILGSIEEGKKTAYDEAYIEKLYEDFQNREVDDSALIEKLKEEFKGRKILILAPGSSISEKKDKICEFIEKNDPVIISSNFVPEDYEVTYSFFSNAMRWSAAENPDDPDKVLITSNLTDTSDIGNVLSYSDLTADEKGKCDNSVIMILKLILRLGITDAYIAGFDGYSEKNNYVSSYMASQYTKGPEVNARNKGYISSIRKKMNLEFITPSLYE
ncbi:MAG: aldolase catalytic domain-containing protein [Lachnospiraceae bacterium]|nr:aldolase catalytic domain-containing protein [Lachnospiraceae bacterium]